MAQKRGKLIQVSTYLSPELWEQLKTLAERTRVSQAAYFREAVEDLLKKYASELREAKGTKARK